MHRPLALAATLLTAVALTSCGSDGGAAGDEARLHVVAAFYPLEFATQQVVAGVDGVSVEALTGPGVDAHDLELTPRQVGSVSEADLVVYSAGMQPAVDGAVSAQAAHHRLDVTTVAELVDRTGHDGEDDDHAEPDHADDEHADDAHADDAHGGAHADDADAHAGHDHGPLDPHFWLDPERYATVVEAIAADLAELDPDHAGAYRANAEAFAADLHELDADFSAALSDCDHDTMVTTHEAFGYLADRYGLHQVGITGISPEAEASPRRMAEITHEIESLDVAAIYAESSVGGDLAEVIATETGTEVLVLDPVESITAASPGGDYLEVMRANLESLRQGQGCA